MKNNDIQEIRPIYVHEGSSPTGNEVSLVDFAMVLVRRKKIIAASITAFIIIGLTLAFIIPKSYTYTTTLEVGSQFIAGSVKPFEAPQTLLAKIQYSFIPQALNQQRLDHPEDNKKFKIKVSIPKNSVIILLEVKGSEANGVVLSSLLSKITTLAINDHQHIYDAVKENLIAQIKQSKLELDSLGSTGNDNLAEQRRFLSGNIELQNAQLTNLRNTREVLQPLKSLEATGISKKLIVIVTVFIGVFIGIFNALFAEFSAKVREKSESDS